MSGLPMFPGAHAGSGDPAGRARTGRMFPLPLRASRAISSAAHACRVHEVRPTHFLLTVDVAVQRMDWYERQPVSHRPGAFPAYRQRRRFVISTSRFGTGQLKDSHCTPLGLHRIADKIGAGCLIGTVFRGRKPVGLTWDGMPDAPIAHRILWLDGLEPGRNRGGDVDSRSRYIYIHGLGDEPSLGRPASRGCIHMAAADLIPLFDVLPLGTLVWIA